MPDAPTSALCGDGVCTASEIGACSADCGTMQPDAGAACGDGSCTAPAETMANCPADCATTSMAVCGNAVCEAGEDATNCPLDCQGQSTCPNGDDIGCFFCWFDPTTCIPPQTEQICAACLGL